jgi:hypothetical protein
MNRRESPRIEIKLRCYVRLPAFSASSTPQTDNNSSSGQGWF